MKIKIYLVILFIVVIISIAYINNNRKTIDNNKLIYHALGSIEGYTYTNSLEALQKNYSKGIQNFEADLVITEDNYVILRHAYKSSLGQNLLNLKHPKKKDFKKSLIYGKYTPMLLDDLVDILKINKDINIYLDIKEKSNIKREKILKQIKEKINADSYSRMYILTYDEKMYNILNKLNLSDRCIYAFYNKSVPINVEKFISFAKKNNIKTVSMFDVFWSKQLQYLLDENDINVYLATINNKHKIEFYFDNNVKMICTDGLF